jgi:hypothetical protein
MSEVLHNHGPEARAEYERQGQMQIPEIASHTPELKLPSGATLLVGDCRAMLRTLEPEYADLGRKRLGVEGKRAWRRMKVGKPKAGQGSLLDLMEE